MTPRTQRIRNACLVTLLGLSAAVLTACGKGPGQGKDAAKQYGLVECAEDL